MAALCHDIAKPVTTSMNEAGRIVSPGHCEMGATLAKLFLKSIGCFPRIVDQVVPLVQEHLVHIRQTHTFRNIKRVAMRLHPANLKQLGWVVEADISGRYPLPKGMPKEMIALIDLADAVQVAIEKPKPLVLGRHLIPLGWQPGKEMGKVLKAAFEAQLDAEFDTVEKGIDWVCGKYLPILEI